MQTEELADLTVLAERHSVCLRRTEAGGKVRLDALPKEAGFPVWPIASEFSTHLEKLKLNPSANRTLSVVSIGGYREIVDHLNSDGAQCLEELQAASELLDRS